MGGSFAQDFKLFMDDDAALLKAADAQWAVTPLTSEGRMGTEPTTEPAVMICDGNVVTVGAHGDCNIIVTGTAVSSFRLHPLHCLLRPDAVILVGCTLCCCSLPSSTLGIGDCLRCSCGS